MSSTDSDVSAAKVVKPKKARKGATNETASEVVSNSFNLSALSKEEVVSKFARAKGDTGSPEVQVALLTQRLETMSKHFGGHPKDRHSQYGMMQMISRRKRLLGYLRTEDVTRYRSTLAALGLRK